MPPVEQTKAKRAGIGLRGFGQERTNLGFTLYVPRSGGGSVFLIDIKGNVVHFRRMPCPSGNYGYLTEWDEPVLSTVRRPENGNTLIRARDFRWFVRGNGRWGSGLGVCQSLFRRGANGATQSRASRPSLQ